MEQSKIQTDRSDSEVRLEADVIPQLTFAEHKEKTADDCKQLAKFIDEISEKVKEGNMNAFEEFFIEGGTEEGDAKIYELLERIILRYAVRSEAAV